jgi:hypothetical protein
MCYFFKIFLDEIFSILNGFKYNGFSTFACKELRKKADNFSWQKKGLMINATFCMGVKSGLIIPISNL